MKVLGFDITVLPDLDPAEMPFWRQWLRGFSQCAFQAHEITGLFFVAAAALYSPRMGAYYVVSVLVGTVVARLCGGIPVLLGLGLYGFNSGLMGLALGNFFQASPALHAWVPVVAAVVALATVAMSRWFTAPFLAAPFILCFWLLWPLADTMGIAPIDLGSFPDAPVHIVEATIAALGSTLFASTTLAGVLFLAGLSVSDWRHALVALMGAVIAASLAAHVGAKGAMINSGFIGFNAVLAALATYALVAADLRLVTLAAVIATWAFSFVSRHAPVPALASGFVLTVWAILLLGWLSPRFSAQQPGAAPGGGGP